MQKPINQSGMTCPMHRVSCAEACHNCELWQPMYQAVDGREQRIYNCAFVWGMFLQGVNNARIDGLQAATEQMRNEFEGFKVSVHQLARVLASAADKRVEHQLRDVTPKDVKDGTGQ